MKVDQYRVLKDTQYSFLVPAGMNLEDFNEPESRYLVAFQPFTLENPDIELTEIVLGAELEKAIVDLTNDKLTVVFTMPMPIAEELNNVRID